MRHINLSNKNMKEINIKSKANKIGKWFEGIGKKIMSIDLIDGQGRVLSMIRRLIILLLLLFSVYVLLDLMVHKGLLTTNEQRKLSQAIQQPLPSPVIALEQTEGSKVDNQTTEDIQKVKTPLQPLGKIVKEYDLWQSMLERCFGEKLQTRRPTYKGCNVSDNFLLQLS